MPENKQKTCTEIRRVLMRQCAGLGIPASGIFELTPRCNLRCRMCYVRMTEEEMCSVGHELTADEWLSLGRQAAAAGMVFLLITGGEPTIRSDFPEIYEGLSKLGLSVSINTNGTHLTTAVREVFHRMPPASVNVTLYGVCREDYAALCGNPDAFDAVCKGLDWLLSEGILVHLNTTIVPANHEKWREIEAFAAARGLELRMTTYCFPPTRKELCARTDGIPFERLSPEDAAHLTLDDIRYREGDTAVLRHAADMDTPGALTDDCVLPEEVREGNAVGCMAGSAQFWMTWDGRMTPCGMLSSPVAYPDDGNGNFDAAEFPAAWEALKKETAALRLCPDCVACPERHTCMNCAAVTVTETGCFDGRPDYMCRLNRAYRSYLSEMAAQISGEKMKNR
ncbi:MAG: radical SAM protein [Clostridia bacterium]|nr:radical SAM protein [Clostridia bacterium]